MPATRAAREQKVQWSKRINVIDPILFAKTYWPDVTFYRQQQEIIYSVIENDETYVPAGNQLGKDFVAGFIALWWFVSRRPARVVTTSVKMDQLEDVLWGEIRRFVQTAISPLPIQYNHMKIRQVKSNGKLVPNAELVGQVSNTQEGLLGRHSTTDFKARQYDISRTLVIFDEASGIDDQTYNSTQTWAQRKLIIGNPFPCNNFFKRGVKAGDLPRKSRRGYHRRVIKIRAVDSPNIRYGLEEQRLGRAPSNRIFIPGVKSFEKYEQDQLLWDDVLKKVGLEAEFYEGVEVLLYPPDWLNAAEDYADLIADKPRQAEGMGVDPGEGVANTCITVVDRFGIIDMLSIKTPDTSIIPTLILSYMHKHNLSADQVCIDRGGGGKEHADALRADGYGVRTIGFGEKLAAEAHTGILLMEEKTELKEHQYVYKNRRAEMYGDLRRLLDPNRNAVNIGLYDPVTSEPINRFAIPRQYHELRRQLAPIPLMRDEEGRLVLPPKNKKDSGGQEWESKSQTKKITLTDLIGRSPDEADSLVLAIHAMLKGGRDVEAGGID